MTLKSSVLQYLIWAAVLRTTDSPQTTLKNMGGEL
jgi:hypothetical protein